MAGVAVLPVIGAWETRRFQVGGGVGRFVPGLELALEFDWATCSRFWVIEIVSGRRSRLARRRVVDRSRSSVVCTCTIF